MMKLTMFERMVLANQYRIMLKLCGDNDSEEELWIKEKLEAIMGGYEREYEHGMMETNPMTDDECNSVIDTLEMYRALKIAVRKHKIPGNKTYMTFDGYDNHTEGRELGYAKYYCGLDGGRFEDLGMSHFDSHAPRREKYERMVKEWKKLPSSHDLTPDDVERILKA